MGTRYSTKYFDISTATSKVQVLVTRDTAACRATNKYINTKYHHSNYYYFCCCCVAKIVTAASSGAST